MLKLPTPHYDKLSACLDNSELPLSDRERLEEALNRFFSFQGRTLE